MPDKNSTRPGPAPVPASERIDKLTVIGTEDQCWIWVGAKNRDGYGIIWDGKTYHMAHRVAYERAHGPIPEGLVVRHSCDTPQCCNPAHLSVGSAADNSRDMVDRGRSLKGEGHPRARLTETLVREIFAKAKSGQVMTGIAKDYGVHEATVRSIVTGRRWAHVTEGM